LSRRGEAGRLGVKFYTGPAAAGPLLLWPVCAFITRFGFIQKITNSQNKIKKITTPKKLKHNEIFIPIKYGIDKYKFLLMGKFIMFINIMFFTSSFVSRFKTIFRICMSPFST
jgi:hypothetical protein